MSAKLTDAEKRAARNEPDAASEAEALAVDLKNLHAVAPQPPTLVASDATPQAIGLMLSRNNERALVASAEAAIVEVMLGRYSDGRPDLDMFLAAQAGDPIEVERIGREPVRLVRPALSMGLALQPEAVRGLYESRIAAGRGLLARFQTVWPAPMVGHRELRPADVPSASAARYERTISDLLEALPGTTLLPDEIDAWRELGRLPDAVLVLRFDAPADGLMLGFRAEVERALNSEGDEAASVAWLSKLPGTVARIAGVLHAAAHGIERDRLVDADTMRAAIAWGRYLWQHTRRVDGLAGTDEAVAVAERVARWIRRKGTVVFSKRDAFDTCRGALCTAADQMDAPLALLVERGWIRPLATLQSARPIGGRPPSPRFEVNPAVLKASRHPSVGDTPSHNPQNPRNHRVAHNGVSCAGSAGSAPPLGGDGRGGSA